jgi:Leucine-rich repeat (LRR) protein
MPISSLGNTPIYTNPIDTNNSEREKKFYTELVAWKMRGAPDERRGQAVNDIVECYESKSEVLGLRLLNLRDLPDIFDFLDFVKVLDISDNELKELPGNLPPSLIALDADFNRITYVREDLPVFLETLKLSGNLLEQLPRNLGESLKKLKAYQNNLTSIPDRLPFSLELFSVEKNFLNEIPIAVFSLSHRCEVRLCSNSLSEAILRKMDEIVTDENYAGPTQITYELPPVIDIEEEEEINPTSREI